MTASGEVDRATAAMLEHALCKEEDVGASGLVLDLRGLSFMDCSGLQVLCRAQSGLGATSRRLEVVCGSGQVRRLLELTASYHGLEIVARPTVSMRNDGVLGEPRERGRGAGGSPVVIVVEDGAPQHAA